MHTSGLEHGDKAWLLLSIPRHVVLLVVITCVNVKFTQVIIGAVSSTPHLDPPLYGLHRHVLLQGGLSLVLYHCLIDSLLTVGIIIYLKVSVQVIEKFPHFEKIVKVWLSSFLQNLLHQVLRCQNSLQCQGYRSYHPNSPIVLPQCSTN